MANFTTPITRTLNKTFKAQMPEGLRVQAGCAGSFLFIRIDDPNGLLSVKLAHEIAREAGKMFYDIGAAKSAITMQGVNYHMEGVVANWERV